MDRFADDCRQILHCVLNVPRRKIETELVDFSPPFRLKPQPSVHSVKCQMCLEIAGENEFSLHLKKDFDDRSSDLDRGNSRTLKNHLELRMSGWRRKDETRPERDHTCGRIALEVEERAPPTDSSCSAFGNKAVEGKSPKLGPPTTFIVNLVLFVSTSLIQLRSGTRGKS